LPAKFKLMNKTKELTEKLFSTDNNTVLDAIQEIQTNGSIEFLPALLKVIQKNKNPKVERKAKAIFFELKDNKAVDFIIEALNSEQYINLRSFLTSACWNNGLDYSAHLPVFVRLFITESFELAFDAFTIVENMATLPEKTIIEEQIAKLKAASSHVTNDKKHLLIEFIKILQNML